LDSSDFSTLIGRLEREAQELPRLHAAKVAAVAALGYAPPAALASLGVICGFSFLHSLFFAEDASPLALFGLLTAVGALAAMIRALWIPGEAPDGVQIDAEDAPELFALLRAAETLNGVRVDSVRINAEFVVSLRQIPRWSVFGGWRNHLQIGLPLLATLSVDEFVALLAHEMGHSRMRDQQFSAWIYRQRIAWSALHAKFTRPTGPIERLLARFYGWCIPYFCAYCFALARAHEYAADHVAAAVTDPQVLGDALIKAELAGRFLAEVFWPSLYAQVDKTPETPRRPYKLMQRALQAGHKAWTRQEWLAQALNKYANHIDPHPSLAERLAALEVDAAPPTYDPGNAAFSLLGPSAETLLSHWDDAWRKQHAAKWRDRHRELQEARWKLAEYERCDESSLGPDDLWIKANLLLNVNRNADAIETLRALAMRQGSHGKAHMLLGELLLARGDERGLQHLIAAAGQDAALIPSAGELGYSYLVKRGRKQEALRFWRQVSPAAAVGGSR